MLITDSNLYLFKNKSAIQYPHLYLTSYLHTPERVLMDADAVTCCGATNIFNVLYKLQNHNAEEK